MSFGGDTSYFKLYHWVPGIPILKPLAVFKFGLS
jgi:hypothetical protein